MGGILATAKIVAERGRRFLGRPGMVQSALRREFAGELAPRILRVGRQTAPHSKGALARGLRSTVFRRGADTGVELKSTVRSRQGYPYTGVTRFGHRKRWIEPRRARALATPWGPRARVRGYRPARDWADDTHARAQPHVARSAQRIGRQLQSEVA
jgi:hypothetical protein